MNLIPRWDIRKYWIISRVGTRRRAAPLMAHPWAVHLLRRPTHYAATLPTYRLADPRRGANAVFDGYQLESANQQSIC